MRVDKLHGIASHPSKFLAPEDPSVTLITGIICSLPMRVKKQQLLALLARVWIRRKVQKAVRKMVLFKTKVMLRGPVLVQPEIKIANLD